MEQQRHHHDQKRKCEKKEKELSQKRRKVTDLFFFFSNTTSYDYDGRPYFKPYSVHVIRLLNTGKPVHCYTGILSEQTKNSWLLNEGVESNDIKLSWPNPGNGLPVGANISSQFFSRATCTSLPRLGVSWKYSLMREFFSLGLTCIANDMKLSSTVKSKKRNKYFC